MRHRRIWLGVAGPVVLTLTLATVSADFCYACPSPSRRLAWYQLGLPLRRSWSSPREKLQVAGRAKEGIRRATATRRRARRQVTRSPFFVDSTGAQLAAPAAAAAAARGRKETIRRSQEQQLQPRQNEMGGHLAMVGGKILEAEAGFRIAGIHALMRRKALSESFRH